MEELETVEMEGRADSEPEGNAALAEELFFPPDGTPIDPNAEEEVGREVETASVWVFEGMTGSPGGTEPELVRAAELPGGSEPDWVGEA